ncbi:MAG: EAL domain-containing protein [Thainema sp.]
MANRASRWLANVSLRHILIFPFVVHISPTAGLPGWLSIRTGQTAVCDIELGYSNVPRDFCSFSPHWVRSHHGIEVVRFTLFTNVQGNYPGTQWETDDSLPAGGVDANTRSIIWFGLGALVLAAGSSMLTVRWMAQPLLQLSQAAKEVAQGDFQRGKKRVTGMTARNGAVGELARSFSQMADQLQASFGQLQTLNAELVNNEERLRLAFRSARMGSWDWDVVHDFVVWDDRMYELYGIRPEDFSGTYDAWKAGVHPDDFPACQLALQQALTGEKDYEIEFRIVRPNGEIRHIEAYALVQRDAAGQPLRMIGANLDISDRKTLEQDLLEQQRLLDTFVSSSPVGICVMDDQLRFTLINDALAEINGVPVADHIGKTPWDIVPDLAPKQREVFQQVLSKGEAMPGFEVVGETPKLPGVTRTWLASYFPLKSESEQTIGIGIIVVETTERSRAEQALRDSEEKFRQLAENIQEVFWLTDAEINQLLYVSQAYEQIWGRSCESLTRDPSGFLDTIHPDDRQRVDQALGQPGVPFEIEYRVVHPDGSIRWIRDRGFPVFDADGKVTRRAGLARDITERKQTEDQLQDLTDRLGLAAKSANMGIWELDLVSDRLIWDDRMYEIYGIRPDELGSVYDAWQARVYADDLLAVQAMEQKALAGEQDYEIEFRIIWPDGNVRHIASYALVQRDANGHPWRMVGANLDITERKQVEAQLIHNALHDALTDLPNRSLLINRLELAIHRTQRLPDYQFAVLFLDLDQFKVINDSLGHLAGDQLLITVASKLQHILRTTDLAARLGGDEFVILLEEIEGIQTAVQVAERIFAEFETAHLIDGRNIFTTTSIGIVLGSAAYSDASDLLRDADIALYRAKAQGRAKYEIFDADMHTQALKRMNLEHDLRRAIDQQELIIHYQPIVTLSSQTLIGFEALIRWQHPTQGLVSPADFIPIAEETGLIVAIDQWLLQAACQQLVGWRSQFPDRSDLKISINLSFQDLRQPDLLQTIVQSLERSGLEAQYLTLEITESMLIKDIESTIGLLEQLRELGIQISIDDFGTGYSSLSYLYNLPTDYLKIDQSFVRTMQQGDKNYKIVEAIIGLSNQLEIDAIAEGIETSQQLDWLQELDCELGQGYLFAKPLTAEAVFTLLSYETQR